LVKAPNNLTFTEYVAGTYKVKLIVNNDFADSTLAYADLRVIEGE
jgi:hypothetical protein